MLTLVKHFAENKLSYSFGNVELVQRPVTVKSFFVLFIFEGSVLVLSLRMTKETFTTVGTWITVLSIY